ncbi:MAG: stage 0 sporulation family protein [Roseiflexus sp.]|nr:stage 0 sporulation family protein [Roseiflexus sp.]MCS7289235.1 stage 0 sporulation family protein [Roseiflexus sp.]MDW8232648.1 stage 0 sporulation family protein [Roseiflexaceae bacterium]
MPLVVGIRFKDSGKTYYFDPNGIEALAQGEYVIVETVRGPELAKVAYPPRLVDPEEIVGELKPVLRRAEPLDFERLRQLNSRQDELLARCAEKIQEHGLPMRLVKAEYSFDGSRLTFYFTAEKRVDFRALVRDLARTFRTRIELRQIGPRDEAKLLGGIGPCGRLLCCATFLPDYARVSIKMAKDQDLPLNPAKISGVCGRLLCCLSYEHEHYVSVKSRMPRKGTWVQTPDGPGEVVGVNVLRETVIVALASTGMQEEFSPTQIQEATRHVGEIARSRNAEGITPVARMRSERQERRADQGQGRQGGKRLLRESINNPDVLEALAWLEEGIDDVPLEMLDEEDLTLLVDETPQPHSSPDDAEAQSQRPSDRSDDLAAFLGEETSQPPASPASATPQRPRRRRRHRNV